MNHNKSIENLNVYCIYHTELKSKCLKRRFVMILSAVCHSAVTWPHSDLLLNNVFAWGRKQPLWTNSLVFVLYRLWRDCSVRKWQKALKASSKADLMCEGEPYLHSRGLTGYQAWRVILLLCIWHFHFALYKKSRPSRSGFSSWNWFLQTAALFYPCSLL